jgi:protein-S-isoprenylcysteine O-methyltransferase Ste14
MTERPELREKPVHMLIWVAFFVVSVIPRVVYGPFLFPIPLVAALAIGSVVLFLGLVVWWNWSKLWREKAEGQLVTGGLYRHVRHPHYLSIIVISLGVTFLMQSLIFLICTLFTSLALFKEAQKEERLLTEIFGAQYREYMDKVRWRFIPRVI